MQIYLVVFSMFYSWAIYMGGSSDYDVKPDNDELIDAQEMMINTGQSCTSIYPGTLVGATPSPESECGGSIYGPFDDDVWYRFTTPANPSLYLLNISNILGDRDLDFQLRSGPTGGTLVWCNYNVYATRDVSYVLDNLNVNTTYYWRVASYDTSASTTFDICIKVGNEHDVCTEAIPITVSGASCTSYSIGDLGNATLVEDDINCAFSGSSLDADIWFSFEATQDLHEIVISNIVNSTGSSTDLKYEVYSGDIFGSDCSALTGIYCQNEPNDILRIAGLSSGELYYLRVSSHFPDTNTITFDVCVRNASPSPPANDNCAQATTIVATDDQCSQVYPGTLAGATHSPIAGTCSLEDPFLNDVWYSFTATATTHIVSIQDIGNANGTGSFQLQLLQGDACFGLTEVGCSSTEVSSFGGLVILSKYYLRVASDGGAHANATFNICLKAGCSLLVNNEDNIGLGTLRSALSCAQSGDVITFHSSLAGTSISLGLPTIAIHHDVTLLATASDNITLTNADPNNSNVLLDIHGKVTILGLKLSGQNETSFIWQISEGGDVEFVDSEMNNISVTSL